MRKAGDVQNGPFAEIAMPLIIIDDRVEPDRALIEIGNLASVTRAFQSPTSCESCARSSHFIRIPLAESALGKSEADTGSENPKNVWQNW